MKLSIIKYGNQAIMTTKTLAEVYETEPKNINNNFKRNEKRFIEGKHYFKLEGEELKEFKAVHHLEESSLLRINCLYLWTERGADRHCKILDTEKAWEQFDNLEETYFRVKENVNPLLNQSKEIQAIFVLDEKQQKLEHEVKDLKDNMPLFVTECKELSSLVKRTGVKLLGGKNGQAYKDASLRGKVYADIYGQLKREFGVVRYEAILRRQYSKAKDIVNNYVLPLVLENQVTLLNNQIVFS